jgi:hypothetical protein
MLSALLPSARMPDVCRPTFQNRTCPAFAPVPLLPLRSIAGQIDRAADEVEAQEGERETEEKLRWLLDSIGGLSPWEENLVSSVRKTQPSDILAENEQLDRLVGIAEANIDNMIKGFGENRAVSRKQRANELRETANEKES